MIEITRKHPSTHMMPSDSEAIALYQTCFLLFLDEWLILYIGLFHFFYDLIHCGFVWGYTSRKLNFVMRLLAHPSQIAFIVQMADIPINLNLDQCLIPTYSNHPRFAQHAMYDGVLKAFVLPDHLPAATKARKGAHKSSGKGTGKGAKKGKLEETETPTVTESPPHDEGFEKQFICEKAKSGISRCRKCGQPIAKDSLRFGYASPDPRGEYGAIPIWFHIRCAPLSFVGFDVFDETLAALCFGFDALPAEVQQEVRDTAGKVVQATKILEDDDEYAEDFDGAAAPSLSERLVHRRGVSVPLLSKPPEITGATLLPFQLEGYSWMVAQESNPATRGGILADEMGMGKTLQTIALIVSKRDTVRPTLVVCPVAAVMQWYSEIEKFTGNLLSIHVYHGSQKISAEKLTEFDIVLTTYQTLENDYRKESNKAKVKCRYCKRMFLPGKLSFHLKYMCGPNAMRTMKQSMREIKDKGATEKAKRTMGITAESEAPPTVANVLREIVKKSGLVKDEKLDGMSHYDLMRVYNRAPAVDGVDDLIPKEEVLVVSTASSVPVLDEQTLKKKTVTQLKELLEARGVTNYPAKPKKDDLIKLCLMSGSIQADAPASDRSSSSSSDSSSDGSSSEASPPAKRRPPASKAAVKSETVRGRRSAASKALDAMKSLSTSDNESEASVAAAPARKPTVKRGRRQITADSTSSSSSSSDDWEESAEDASSSSDYTDSESSGDTVDVCSESDVVSDDDVPVTTKIKTTVGRVKKLAVAARPAGSASSSRVRGEVADGDDGEYDEAEDAVEDIDLNNSPLHCVKWGRLVLDEAHRIKQRTNSTSLAAFGLAADYRWCLTGTPLQNRVGELYSLVRFLRFAPFAHYFCKGCDCKSLHFRFIDNRFCQKCGCARTKHYSYFKQVISGPIIKFGIGDGSALNVLKSQVLDTVLLRRTKIERQADLNLPSISVEIKRHKLTNEEFDFYESIYKQSMLKFDTFAKSGTLLHNYAHIFDLLTRLRQALDHPYLIVYGADYVVPTATVGTDTITARGVCALCQDDIGAELRAVANCGHKFHSDCVKEYIKEAPQLVSGGCGCPACFVPLTLIFENDDENESPPESGGNSPEQEDDLQLPSGGVQAEVGVECPPVKGPKTGKKLETILDRVGATGFQSSTKIESLVDEMKKLGPDSKVLIFSQFTRMLDLVEFRIKQNGVSCAKLTGSLNLTQRTNIIMAFNSDPSMKALLISLKAGGEGLNLQAADHVFLIDPWWNPASELQAIQRAHRIGQTRPVKAIRFVTENSVEEKVVALQEMKQLVFDATVGQSQGAEKKLTESDLRFLFQH